MKLIVMKDIGWRLCWFFFFLKRAHSLRYCRQMPTNEFDWGSYNNYSRFFCHITWLVWQMFSCSSSNSADRSLIEVVVILCLEFITMPHIFQCLPFYKIWSQESQNYFWMCGETEFSKKQILVSRVFHF